MADLSQDWLQMSPAWRDFLIHQCLCGIKQVIENKTAEAV